MVKENPTYNVHAESNFWMKGSELSVWYAGGSTGRHHRPGGQSFCWRGGLPGCSVHSVLPSMAYTNFRQDNQELSSGWRLLSGWPSSNLNGLDVDFEKPREMFVIQDIVAARHVFIIQLDDGSERLVAVIEVSMMEIWSCVPIVKEGQHVNKGDEIGFFQFGESSLKIIFDKDLTLNFNPSIYKRNKNGAPTKQLVNSWLATYDWTTD